MPRPVLPTKFDPGKPVSVVDCVLKGFGLSCFGLRDGYRSQMDRVSDVYPRSIIVSNVLARHDRS